MNGSQLSVTTYGEGSAVLLLHGFPFSGVMWEPVARLLARSGRRVLVADLRGFGASEGAPVESLRDHTDDLVGLLDALGLHEPVPWIGFSMGGYIALEAWRRHPGRIGRLGLVDTRAGADDDSARAGRLATALRVEKEGSAVVADAMLPKLFSPKTAAPQRASHYAAMKTATSVHVAAALRAMAGRADSRSLLATISVPTVVVVGADDVITPPAEAEALVRGISGARLHVIAAAGHMAPVEQPAAVASALAELLA